MLDVVLENVLRHLVVHPGVDCVVVVGCAQDRGYKCWILDNYIC